MMTKLLMPRRGVILLNKSISRSYYKKQFDYQDSYKGKFDYHDREKYPKRMSPYKEEELLDEIHAIKAMEVEHPSPFHVVCRVRDMRGQPWHHKVALRRLNLHSIRNGECLVVPNTPQFNDLLLKVKHLITLKPAIFENGRMPTEEDIGAIKVCPTTGRIKIDEKLRLNAKRLTLERPPMFEGTFLRYKIATSFGIHSRSPTQRLT